ncbi:MAG: hypothetical protein D6754_09065 [Alphaproteobacteria bacterium]|nr:MAG: hypothetical protein D6754_09065 [Alphaproteobacteria bacterium]
MRRIACALALLPALHGAAMAQTALNGVWSVDDKPCTAKSAVDEARFRIGAKRIDFYESRCEIVQSRSARIGRSWGLQLKCTGEGENWEALALAMVTAEDELIIYWDDGYSLIARRCK